MRLLLVGGLLLIAGNREPGIGTPNGSRFPVPGSRALPNVLVIATGGTISNMGSAPRRTGDELVAGIPELKEIANVTAEQFSNVASGAVTIEMWRKLATRINEALRGPSPPDGIIVTHGTDTLEETAFFLDLTVGGCVPVVVTGAMRRADVSGADGPANLLNAVRVVVSPHARGRGTMVVMNDLVFDAREVSKVNTTRVDAFSAPWVGPIGVADPDSVWFHRPDVSCKPAAFDIAKLGAFPRVDIVESYIDADSVIVDALVKAGAKGIVVAGVGRGGSTPAQGRALRRAVQSGVFVVSGSRTGSGRVGLTSPSAFADWKPGSGAMLGAGDLNPAKARVLLMLALARSGDARQVAEAFAAR
jgi:L-asparaginase